MRNKFLTIIAAGIMLFIQCNNNTDHLAKTLAIDPQIAVDKPSRQSSNYNVQNSYPAEKANDGRNQPLHGANFNHTGSEMQPWWEVDLLDTFSVTQVDVINRIDNGTVRMRLRNFKIFVTNTPATSYSDPATATHVYTATIDSLKFPVSATGRYVRLWADRPLSGYLHISEVRVFGVPSSLNCRDTIIQVPVYRNDTIRICN